MDQDSVRTTVVLGVPVCVASEVATLDHIQGYLADPWDGVCRHVATVNPEYVMATRSDPDFAAAMRSTDLNTIDGIGVLIAARTSLGRGVGPIDRLTGVRITEALAELSDQSQSPIYMLGAGPGVADAAAIALKRRYPGTRIAGTWDGGTPAPADDRESLDRVAACGTRVVLVAYGARGQVAWIDRNRHDLAASGVRLVIGVGGTFDMISGRVRRAPDAVRRIGLEWLYRLVSEPWRWRRQLALPRFAALVILERIRHRAP